MKRVFFEAKKVQLNESFKKLYGFNKKAYKDSYCAQLENIITMFPGFTSEFDELLLDLELKIRGGKTKGMPKCTSTQLNYMNYGTKRLMRVKS